MRYDELIRGLSWENVESLVSSGAQKAIKEIGQGRGGQTHKIYSRRKNGAGFGDRAYFHHDCVVWLSSTFHYVVWRCFFLTTIIWYLKLWGPYAFCHRSSVETSHFEFQTAKHWVSTLRYMVPMKMQKSDYFALYWKQIFYLFFPLLLELPTLKSWRRNCFDCARLFKKITLGKRSFHELAMLTQVYIECLTAKMPFFSKMWLGKLYRKRLIPLL